MNLPNFSALVLMVLAFGFLLFGFFFSATTLVKDPATTIRQTETFMPPVETSVLELVEKLPGLIALGILFFFSLPALFLAAAGVSVWRFVGRPRVRRYEIEASLEKERESVLQTFLDGGVDRLVGSREPLGAWIGEGIGRISLQIDPGRQQRLRIFLKGIGCDEGSPALLIPGQGETPTAPPQRATLARALALVFFLFAAFGVFWGVMVGLIAQPSWKMLDLSLGLQVDTTDALIAMSMCFVLSAVPAAAGAGLLGLARLDRRLEQRWRLARQQAQEVLLAGLHRQLATLLKELGQAGPEERDLLRWARALTVAAFSELDGPGRRELFEILHRHGLTRQDLRFLGSGDRGFDGALFEGFQSIGADPIAPPRVQPGREAMGDSVTSDLARPGRAYLRHNLILETVSLFLLFGFLAVVVVVAVAIFNIVAVEYTEAGRSDLSQLELETVFNSQGYLLIFTMLTIPAVITILAGIGIRRLLLRPEPPPGSMPT